MLHSLKVLLKISVKLSANVNIKNIFPKYDIVYVVALDLQGTFSQWLACGRSNISKTFLTSNHVRGWRRKKV